jgi:hypothetical protein
VLLPGLAFVPVFFFNEAHSAMQLFCLYTVNHALVKGVAGVCSHTHGMERLHYDLIKIIIIIYNLSKE